MPRIREITAAMPPGYGLEIGGEQEETAKSQADMGRAMGISLILIVLCLVVQYNSLAKPGMILVTIPLAWTGAYLALFLTGRPLGFMATLGLLSLTGVVLNDAIVLVEFVEMRIRDTLASGEGRAAPGEKSVCGLARDVFRAAVAEGSGMRIKPIMLTTLTTVGGLVPLVMFGGPLWAPMAIVIMGGMLYATLMTLFVLPAVFCIFVENFGVRVGTDHRAAATEGGIK